MLTQPEVGLDIVALGYRYQIAWEGNETPIKGMRRIISNTSGPYNPTIFLDEPVSNGGIENWGLSPVSPRPPYFPATRADYMVGQMLMDGRTGRKVTDPFV
jgi:hypothetical protein